MNLLSRRRPVSPRGAPRGPAPAPTLSGAARQAVAEMCFELVPVGRVDAPIAALPPGARVSVTCSPVKGIAATEELSASLLDLGHHTVPHLSARMVESRDHVARIAAWIRAHGVREVFVVGGDGAVPLGPHADATSFLRDLLAHDTGLTRVGVAAYPDGHPVIPSGALVEALHAKQALGVEAGVAVSATTQMCFDVEIVRRWLATERARGLTVPVALGIPGVVDRARLVMMGVRLGVGASLRYLRKHRATMTTMLAPTEYDPTVLVDRLVTATDGLGASDLHVFTFNSVADTAAWQRRVLAP